MIIGRVVILGSIMIFTFVFGSIGCASTNTKTKSEMEIRNALDLVNKSPDKEGTLIYEGAVYPLGFHNTEQVFSYERRVKDIPGGLSAIHITRDAGKNILLTQTAKYAPKYLLREFEFLNSQTGVKANVEVKGKQIQYRVTDKFGEVSSSVEEVSDPVVVGPNLFGTIAEHWEELMKGSSLYLRFAVAEMKQSYRFEVKKIQSTDTITRFEMKATNWIIGLAINPFIFEYDTSKRIIITYQGRVPPMRTFEGKLKELDAKVIYTHLSSYK